MIDLTRVSRALMDYWQDVRGDDLVPARRLIQPAAMKSLLPFVMLLDWQGERKLIYRLAGTEIARGFGMELRGHNLFDFTAEADHAAQERSMAAICDHPCGLVAELVFAGRYAMPQEYQVFHLPLADDDGAHTKMIGVISATQRDYDPHELEGPSRVQGYRAWEFFDIGAGVPDQEEVPDGSDLIIVRS